MPARASHQRRVIWRRSVVDIISAQDPLVLRLLRRGRPERPGRSVQWIVRPQGTTAFIHYLAI